MDGTNETRHEALLAFIQNEWTDIHHSRVQEWSALGVVTGAHIAVTQMPSFLTSFHVEYPPHASAVVGCLIGLAFAVIGGLVTCRHRRLMEVKFSWLYNAEKTLGLIKTDTNPDGVIPPDSRKDTPPPWNGLSLPRGFSTSGLILSLYGLFGFFDLACLGLVLAAK